MQSDILHHMQPKHLAAFQGAARRYAVAILVRRTNTASLWHVGKPYALPKRLDCKAKTADYDFTPSQGGLKEVAGLVVDPRITGPGAFKPTKYPEAVATWKEFASSQLNPRIQTLQDLRRFTYVPDGRFYFVELDPASPYYGCVKFSSNSNIAAGKCVHGDFDLYAIVPMDDPGPNVATYEKRLNTGHARSPQFFDVQHCVNHAIGVPMVQHGADESYRSRHRDEPMDIFYPSGEVGFVANGAELARLYSTTFRGRKLFTRHDLSGTYQVAR
jgi:hypothetical protein